MKNLIIIGNGFDLAHGLKTSYSDFFNDLKKKVQDLPKDFTNIVHTKTDNKDKIILDYKSMGNNVNTQWNNKLIHNLTSMNTNLIWSDIEYTYFKILQNYNDRKYFTDKFKHDKIYTNAKQLNDEFETIKYYLELYLAEEQKNFNKIDEISYLFSKFKSEDTTVLNFNYSNTIKEYLRDSKMMMNQIQIHGELNNPDNPIIFGFAANDKESKELIDKDENDLMKNIKKINYKLTNNEFQLKQQLNDENTEWIDILIIGHSIGVSDRHILNEILNHNKVNSIRVLHYNGIEGYRNLAINIDRIVDDYSKEKSDAKVFPKLLNYKMCCKMIQHNSSKEESDNFVKYIDNIFIEQEILREKHFTSFLDVGII